MEGLAYDLEAVHSVQKTICKTELNHHDYKFLCSQCKCKKSFTSKSALDKHSITHKPPHFMCSMYSKEFFQKYQMESHKNVHDTDKEFRCLYPRCNLCTKARVSTIIIIDPTVGNMKNFSARIATKLLQKKEPGPAHGTP